MKSIIALALVFSTTLAFAAQSGQITLNGKKLAVQVNEKTIVVGGEEFKINGQSSDKIEASLKVIANGKITADKNLFLVSGSTVSEIAKDPSMLTNASEVKCTAKSTTFIMIGDNLNAPYPLVGNCLILK